jgi:hypothetical protein
MTPRDAARVQALGRIALGAALVVVPRVLAGAWVGDVAGRREVQALAIGLGARDVALGVGQLRAASMRSGAAPWVRAGMAADVADLVATVRARHALPSVAVPVVAGLAGGSAVLGAWLQNAVD